MLLDFELFDVDVLSRPNAPQAPTGVSIEVQDSCRKFRRYRPDYVAAVDHAEFERHYYHPNAHVPWVGFVRVENALVLQDNLLIASDSLLVGRCMMYPPEIFPYRKVDLPFTALANGRWQAEIPNAIAEFSGTTASLVVDGWQIYGHWLIDMLPKLERLMTSDIHVDRYLFPAPNTSWQFAMLEAAGLPLEKCVFVDLATTAVRCERLVVPTYDRFNSEIRPDFIRAHERIRIKFAGDITPELANRNIFVARGAGSRPLVNRDDIEGLVLSLGFEIVRPETMALTEQIRLFASARAILGECGSALNNAVFSLPGTHVCAIQNAHHPDHLQAQIAMLKGQNMFYALGEPAGAEGAFHVPVKLVESTARRLIERHVDRSFVSSLR